MQLNARAVILRALSTHAVSNRLIKQHLSMNYLVAFGSLQRLGRGLQHVQNLSRAQFEERHRSAMLDYSGSSLAHCTLCCTCVADANAFPAGDALHPAKGRLVWHTSW